MVGRYVVAHHVLEFVRNEDGEVSLYNITCFCLTFVKDFNEMKARAQAGRNYNVARVEEAHTIHYQQSSLKNEVLEMRQNKRPECKPASRL
jgi:phage regulator Rha-like protein